MSRVAVTPDGVEHRFPDVATDSQIHDALPTAVLRVGAGPSGGFAKYAVPADQSRVGAGPPLNRNLDWGRAAVNALPAIGGAAGGIAGGGGGAVFGLGLGGWPGAVGGAAFGGAGGEAARQHIIRALPALGDAPETASEALGGIGSEALRQGVLEAGGRVLSGAVRVAGKGLMKAAIRPTPTLKGRFPNLVDVAVGEGRIPLRDALRNGIQKSIEINRGRLKGMNREMDSALDRALEDGNWYSPDQFLATVNRELKSEVSSNPLRVRYMKSLRSMMEDFRRGWRGPVTPAQPASMILNKSGAPMSPGSPAQQVFPKGEPLSPRGVRRMKRSAQKTAVPIYNAGAKGNDPGATRAMEGEFQAAVAKDARASLAKLPTLTRGQNVAALDERMQNLIGLKQALVEASNRYYGSGLPMLPSAINWAVPAAARSPDFLYPLALSLTGKGLHTGLRQAPRTLDEILSMFFSSNSPTQVGGR